MSGTYYAVRLGPDRNPARGTVIAEAAADGCDVPPSIRALWQPGQVAIVWNSDEALRQLAPETLAKRRLTRMRNKLARTAPLFADQLEARELAERPDFYAGKRT